MAMAHQGVPARLYGMVHFMVNETNIQTEGKHFLNKGYGLPCIQYTLVSS